MPSFTPINSGVIAAVAATSSGSSGAPYPTAIAFNILLCIAFLFLLAPPESVIGKTLAIATALTSIAVIFHYMP